MKTLKQFAIVLLLICCTLAVNAQCNINGGWKYTINPNQVHVFTDTSTVSAGYQITTRYWTFGDGSTTTQANPSHYYSAPGNYTVCEYIIATEIGGSNTCRDTVCQLVSNCNGMVQAAISANVQGSIIVYTGTGTSNYPPLSYAWTFAGGSPATSNTAVTTVQYNAPGAHQACLTVRDTNGCSATVCRNDTTTATPCGNLIANFNASINSGYVYLSSTSTGTTTNTLYQWWRDGQAITNPTPNTASYQYAPAGIHTYCLYVYSAQNSFCDSACRSYTIDTCTADFQTSVNNNVVTFTPQRTGFGNGNYWSFGDGTSGDDTSASFIHTYPSSPNTTTYQVCHVWGQGNCVDTVCKLIVIPGTTACGNASFTSSQTSGHLVLTSTSTGTNTNVVWAIRTLNGAGVLTGSGTPFAANTLPNGTYQVCLYLYNNNQQLCDTTCQTIAVTNGTTCITLQPDSAGKDAAIETANTQGNRGNYPNFLSAAWVTGGNVVEERSLLQFDLSSIPIGSSIVSARLSLYADTASTIAGYPGQPTYGSNNASYLRRIVNPWTENTVTWANAPTSTATDEILLPQSTSVRQDYPNIDIYNFAQYWVNTPAQNHGMLLDIRTNSPYNSMIFCSSDHPDATRRPKLEICYTPCNASIAFSLVLNSNGSATITPTATGLTPSSYSWSNGSANRAITITAGGNYCVTVTGVGGCSASACYNYTPLPCGTSAFTYSQSSGQLVLTSTSTVPGISRLWTISNANGNILATSSANPYTINTLSNGTYNVCLRIYNSGQQLCDSACQTIAVTNVTTCSGINASFTAAPLNNHVLLTSTSTGTNANTLYQWYSDGVAAGNLSTTPSRWVGNLTPGTHYFCLYVYANANTLCDSVCQTATVANCPAGSAGFTYTTQISAATFYPINSGGVTSYWQFGDGTGVFDTSGQVYHVFPPSATPMVYQVCHTLTTTTCTDTVCQNVTVPAFTICDTASFTVSQTGGTVVLTSTSSGTNTRRWTIRNTNGVTVQTGTGSPFTAVLATGAYQVCLSVYNSNQQLCDSNCQNITVNTTPPTCLTLQPNDSTGKDAAIATSAATSNFGTHVDFFADVWTHSSVPVEHRSLLEFNLSAIPAGSIIVSSRLSLYCDTGTISGYPGQPTFGSNNASYLKLITSAWSENGVTWNNQPPTTTAGQVLLAQSNSYTQDYLNINLDAFTQQWVNTPSQNYGMLLDMIATTPYNLMSFCSSDHPNAAKRPKLEICYIPCTATASITPILNSGSARLEVTATGLTPATYNWSNGATTSSITVTAGGNYCVTVTGTGGCSATACYNYATTPCSGVSAQWTKTYNTNNSISFTASNQVSGNTYLWTFGDGTSATTASPVHGYTTAGLYNVCLIVRRTGTICADTVCQNLQANPANTCTAVASFTTTIVNGSILATSTSTNVNSNSHYYWNVYGSNNNLIQSQSGTNTVFQSQVLPAGTYQVCLYLFGSNTQTFCDSACSTVTIVNANPCNGLNADYTYAYLTSGGVQFYPVTNAGTTTHNWTFGDGTTSTNANPVHYYTTAGLYTICHTVAIPGTNCFDSTCTTIQVTAGNPCSGFGVQVNVTSGWFTARHLEPVVAGGTAPYTYLWSNGATTRAIYPTTTGNYCVTVYDANQCSATDCETFTSNTPPCNASYSYTRVNCSTIQFTNASTGGYTNVVWNFGDGTSSSATNPTHSFGVGTWTVQLTVYSNGSSCQASYYQVITIQPCGINDTICGVVFNDVNGNGVQESNEPGIGGGTIYAGNYHVTVSSNGHYTLILPAGNYTLYYCAAPGNSFTIPVGTQNPNSNTSTCAYYTITTSGGSHCGYNFGVQNNSSTVCGTVYFDANNNQVQDAGETGQANAHVIVTRSNGTVIHSYTDPTGHYCVTLFPGTYTLTVQTQAGFTLTPQAITLTTVAGTNYYNNNFGVYTQPGSCDLRLDILPHTTVTAGFAAYYELVITNLGASTSDGTMNLFFDPALTFISASPAQTSANNSTQTVTWDFTGLTPGSNRHYMVNFRALTNIQINQPVFTLANVTTSNCNEVNYSNNVDTVHQNVTASWDPNNKLVVPDGVIKGDERLTYTVNFQNTGTAPAVNVVVRDTIAPELDIETFEMVDASHAYTVQLVGREVVWKFNAIMLPDSNSNEPQSHGHVSFSILPKPNLGKGTQLTNRADIYFDYNAPVGTNSTLNTIDYELSVADLENGKVTITLMPNPFKEFTTIKIDGENTAYELKMFDMLGQQIYQDRTTNNLFSIQRQTLAAGVYMYQITKQGKVIGQGKMIAE